MAVVEAEQGIVTGPVALTPIQEPFFGQQREDRHHYNQSVLLQAQGRLGEACGTVCVGVVAASRWAAPAVCTG